jgi:hypothetical protein
MTEEGAEKPDKALEPIQYNEAYRIARRNALFWGAVTILVSVGTSNAGTPIEVPAVLRNLSFPQSFLTVFSLVVMLFMLAGYYRADQVFVSSHSGFAKAQRIHGVADEVVNLANVLRELNGAAVQAQQSINEKRRQIETHADRVLSVVTQLSAAAAEPLAFHDRPFRANDFVNMDPVQRDEFRIQQQQNKIDEARASAQAWVQGFLGRLREGIESSLIEMRRPELPPSIEHAASVETRALAQLDQLSQDLHGFADTIGPREKGWFYAYERGAVWIVNLLGAGTAIWRLVSPTTLAAVARF